MSGEFGRQARAIATAVLGRDPGPLTAADSLSHQVYVGPDVVVKVIDAARHARLDREVALAPHLPAGPPQWTHWYCCPALPMPPCARLDTERSRSPQCRRLHRRAGGAPSPRSACRLRNRPG